LPQLTTPALLALAAMGIVLGFFGAVERRETKWVLLWSVVCYVFFSLIIAKEPRYALLLSPAAVILTAIGLWRLARWGANYLSANSSWVFLGLTGIVTAGHLWSASLVRVPYIDGFKEVAAYFKEVAPEEMVFYDGIYDGVFSLYVRLGDPNFKRGVILGDKLLYASAISFKSHLQEYVSSSQDVVERLQSGCGCRWLAIEQSSSSNEVAAAQYLREAVRGPAFEFVRTFQIEASRDLSVDVYRFLLPVVPPDHVELNFPSLGESMRFRVKPIQR
jgi:4-amino-4-deoxy-L-arabinose transferase-like glycosyltransferase